MGNPIFCAHFNGAWTESSKNLTATVNGSPSNTTGSAKFGTYCATVGGTGNYVDYAVDSDFNFGTNAFTIHFWIKGGNPGQNVGVIGFGYTTSNPLIIYCNSSSELIFFVKDSSFTSINMGALDSNWVHFAAVRSGNNFYAFRAGQQQGTTQSSTVSVGNAPYVRIGNYFNQYWTTAPNIDEILIYREALWTANFTPPTAEYSTGWSHTISGVGSPAYVCGVAKTSISKVMGV